MDRRNWLVATATALWLGCCQMAPSSAAEKVDKDDLKKRLEQGLHATSDKDRGYIDRVVSLVDQGKLKVKDVYAVFKWARKRDRNYPFSYFQRALNMMAKRRGIVI